MYSCRRLTGRETPLKPALPCVELFEVDVTFDDRVELDDVTLDDRVEPLMTSQLLTA